MLPHPSTQQGLRPYFSLGKRQYLFQLQGGKSAFFGYRDDKEVDEVALFLGDDFFDDGRLAAAGGAEAAAEVVDDNAAGVVAKFVVDGWVGAVKSDDDAAAVVVGDVVCTGGAVAAADLVARLLVLDAPDGGGSCFFRRTIMTMQMGNVSSKSLISLIEYGLFEGGDHGRNWRIGVGGKNFSTRVYDRNTPKINT